MIQRAIQYTAEETQENEAKSLLESLGDQEGYIGGQLVPLPSSAPERWRVHAFFTDHSSTEPAGDIGGGMRRVVVPFSSARSLGVELRAWHDAILDHCRHQDRIQQRLSGVWVCQACWDAATKIRDYQWRADHDAKRCETCHRQPSYLQIRLWRICRDCYERIDRAIRAIHRIGSDELRRKEFGLADYQEMAAGGAQLIHQAVKPQQGRLF